MVRVTASIAAIVLFVSPSTLAKPMTRADKVQIDHFIYIDKSLKSATSSLKNLVPDLISFSETDIRAASTKKTLSHGPVSQEKKKTRGKRGAIIGEDDRELWTGADDFFPGAAVACLTWDNGLLCSVALVGPRHVLSKYCVPDPFVGGTFAPGYDQTAKFGSSQFTANISMTMTPDPCKWKNEWLIIVLEERLGHKVGWFGVKIPEREKLDKAIFTHQGYAVDLGEGKLPYRHVGTRIHSEGSLECEGGGALRSDTDVADGQSGGPLWEEDEEGRFEIWGVLAGGESDSERKVTTWASGDLMVQMVNEALERWS